MNLFRLFIYSAVFMLVALSGTGKALALSIDDVRFGQHPNKTRMVLDLSAEAPYRVFTLSDPWRLVIDLPSFSWDPAKLEQPGFTGITAIRQGQLDKSTARIVMDFKTPLRLTSVFFLPADGGQSNRLVIDFSPASASEATTARGKVFGKLEATGQAPTAAISREAETQVAAASKMASPIPPKQREVTKAVSPGGMVVPPAKPTPPKKPLIIIDAGHGGADPGAISASGIREKHITLSMAHALKRALEKTGRYEARLTRENDKFLRLHERVNFARHQGGDLFVSLHADSLDKPNVRGASIYTLSEKSSDAQTAKLAMRENRADLIAGVDLSAEDEIVANILVDLAMRDTMNQSKFFANTVVDSLAVEKIKTLENPHRYAGFAVLKAPDIPSILIEMGFLSNATEARLLASESFQKQLAEALIKSFDIYFARVQRNQRT